MWNEKKSDIKQGYFDKIHIIMSQAIEEIPVVPEVQQNPDIEPFIAVLFMYIFHIARVFTFSVGFYIGKFYFASWITPLIPSTWCTVIGVIGYFAFDAYNLWMFLLIFGIFGPLIGAGLAHLSLPSEPFMAMGLLVSVSAFAYFRQFLRHFCYSAWIFPFVTYILIAIPFGWLTKPYLILTAAYILAPFSQPVWLPFFGETLFSCPFTIMFSRCLVYWVFGVDSSIVEEEVKNETFELNE